MADPNYADGLAPFMQGEPISPQLGPLGRGFAEVRDRFNNPPQEPSMIGMVGQLYRAFTQPPAQFGDREGAIEQAMPLAQAAMTGGMPMATRGAVGMAGGRLPPPQGLSGQIIKPAADVAKMYLKDGDLALALERAESSPTAERVPGYLNEIKTELLKQAHPKEIERVKSLELMQEHLGGDIYGGEPRGLVNWLRQQPGGLKMLEQKRD